MFGLLLLIIRRSLRNAPLTAAVLIGLLVLVMLLAAAPLYTAALADVGLRAALADAPLSQRGVRAIFVTQQLQQAEQTRLSRLLGQTAREVAWLKPAILAAISTESLLPPEGYSRGEVSLVEADTALANLSVVEGRLPRATGAGGTTEVVLGAAAADMLGLHLGDRLALSESMGGARVMQIQVVGLVEPADATAPFWQSGLLSLEPTVSASRRAATVVVAPGTLWTQVVPRFPRGRVNGEYRWLIVFDLRGVDSSNVLQAQAGINRVVQTTNRTLGGANAGSDFDTIVADYRQRLAIMRAPLFLLFVEIAGLALIYIAWVAAFQAEATASEQAVLGARGAGLRQIAGISGGQAALLAAGAALAGIPLALLLLRVSARLGPLASLARVQELRLVATPDAPPYALAASAIGFLVLAVPAVPAARRSIVALRQTMARPPTLPFWQRISLDLMVAVVAVVALVQIERQGSLLQRMREGFVIDPFLVVAPFLILVAGALLFLRVYPWLLSLTQGLAARGRGLPLALALVQLTRNRAAAIRLVLLLSLTAGLGLFTQTFGANLARNQRQRAGYSLGADGRATLADSRPLLPGALPPGVRASPVLRDTVAAAETPDVAVPLLAIDPAQFGSVAFNPPDHPILPLPALLGALGPTPPPDGLALPGRPKRFSLALELHKAPYSPAVILSDVAGTFHRLQLAPVAAAGQRQTFAATLDLPAAAFPVRLVALGLLPTDWVNWGADELSKKAVSGTLASLTVDGTVVERWNGSGGKWAAVPAADVDPSDPAAGSVDLRGATLKIARGRQMRAVLLEPNPQELAPVPVAVDEQFGQANHLNVGDTRLLLVRNRPVPVRVVARVAHFPSLGIAGEPFVIAQEPRLLRLLNRSFAPPIAPNEAWLALSDDAATLERVRRTPGLGSLVLQSAVLRSLSRDPLAIGLAGVFYLGFLTSLGLTVLGFATALYLAGRRRTTEFAVLQALGLDRQGVLRTLALEQVILVILALLAGTGLGAGLAHLILPLMAIGDRGQPVVPPYLVIVPWRTLALTYAALIGLFAAVTAIVLWLLLRRGIGRALRIGEE